MLYEKKNYITHSYTSDYEWDFDLLFLFMIINSVLAHKIHGSVVLSNTLVNNLSIFIQWYKSRLENEKNVPDLGQLKDAEFEYNNHFSWLSQGFENFRANNMKNFSFNVLNKV